MHFEVGRSAVRFVQGEPEIRCALYELPGLLREARAIAGCHDLHGSANCRLMVVVDGDFIPEPIVTTHSDLDRTRSGCTDDEVREARIGRRCEANAHYGTRNALRIILIDLLCDGVATHDGAGCSDENCDSGTDVALEIGVHDELPNA
ncbi:hypothetical protein A8D84_21335 [Burkholderia cenocepacia]|nr:hypothetical protein A8D84_21335 [Burkholderia cenocepacia]